MLNTKKSVSITNGWLRGWLWQLTSAHFVRGVGRLCPKWTRNDTLRPTSEPALLRPTSTHFGDIPRPRLRPTMYVLVASLLLSAALRAF